MRILFYLGHPAHWHLFKNLINELDNYQFRILIKTKDVLENLLKESGYEYHNIYENTRPASYFGMLSSFIKKQRSMKQISNDFKPDLIMSTTADASVLGKLIGTPTLIFNDDDVSVIPYFSWLAGPTADLFVAPKTCNMGRWKNKTLEYTGQQKMAYLHPKVFKPKKDIVRKYTDPEKSYFLLRLVKLKAHHDKGVNGISNDLAELITTILKPHGEVLISSERDLPESLNGYRLQINPADIHHLMAYSKALIGDTQSMVVEAAMLGVPAFRFNDFQGRIGVLEELEKDYNLVQSFNTTQEEDFINSLKSFLEGFDLNDHKKRHQKLVNNSVNLHEFMTWYVEEFPASLKKCKDDLSVIENFK